VLINTNIQDLLNYEYCNANKVNRNDKETNIKTYLRKSKEIKAIKVGKNQLMELEREIWLVREERRLEREREKRHQVNLIEYIFCQRSWRNEIKIPTRNRAHCGSTIKLKKYRLNDLTGCGYGQVCQGNFQCWYINFLY